MNRSIACRNVIDGIDKVSAGFLSCNGRILQQDFIRQALDDFVIRSAGIAGQRREDRRRILFNVSKIFNDETIGRIDLVDVFSNCTRDFAVGRNAALGLEEGVGLRIVDQVVQMKKGAAANSCDSPFNLSHILLFF